MWAHSCHGVYCVCFVAMHICATASNDAQIQLSLAVRQLWHMCKQIEKAISVCEHREWYELLTGFKDGLAEACKACEGWEVLDHMRSCTAVASQSDGRL